MKVHFLEKNYTKPEIFLSLLKYKTKITYITVNSDTNDEHLSENYIFEYRNINDNCDQYISSPTYFIGVINKLDENIILYIINFGNTNLKADFKDYLINAITNTSYEEIFKTITLSKLPINNCTKYFDLTKAKQKLNKLNDILLKNCDKYYIGLDYLFNFKENTIVCGYNSKFNPNDLLIGLFLKNSDSCISSIMFSDFNDNERTICINARTMKKYENMKINKILLAASIIITTLISDKISTIISKAINSKSLHLIYNYYNATFTDRFDEYITINPSLSIEKNLNKYYEIKCRVILNNSNITKAVKVFDSVLKTEFKCKDVIGGKKKYNNFKIKKTKYNKLQKNKKQNNIMRNLTVKKYNKTKQNNK